MPNNRKKDFRISDAGKAISVDDFREPPWVQTYANATFDFRRWLFVGRPRLDKNASSKELASAGVFDNLVNAGRDEMVEAVRNAVFNIASKEARTKKSYCKQGLTYWFEYLDYLIAAECPIYDFYDITSDIIENYILWLLHTREAETETGRISYRSAKSIYTALKPIFEYLEKHSVFPVDILPANPFPHSNRSKKGLKPYSKKIMTALMSALCLDIQEERAGRLKFTPVQSLTLRLMIIGARTGRNLTPLLELSRDAVKKHPIKPDRLSLLVTYKRRGSNTSIQAFETTKQVVDMAALPMDALAIYREVLEMTQDLAAELPSEQQDSLWLFRQTAGNNRIGGTIGCLTEHNYLPAIKIIFSRHKLKDDDGRPLKLNITRLRKTFAQRMWHLTGGDIAATSKLMGNEPEVTDRDYLLTTPEMESNFRKLVLIMHADWAGKLDDIVFLQELSINTGIPLDQIKRVFLGHNNTGVGRCADPRSDNGTDTTSLCTRWLECFKCPNLLVLESDLYRLFSFYYLILKEKNAISRTKWDQYFKPIIEIIDTVIIEPNLRTRGNLKGCFDPYRVQQARSRAQNDPHKMWLDRSILGRLCSED